MGKIAFVFPGQGAQQIGMGKDFCEKFESSKKIFQIANENIWNHVYPKCQLGKTKNPITGIWWEVICKDYLFMTFNKNWPDMKGQYINEVFCCPSATANSQYLTNYSLNATFTNLEDGTPVPFFKVSDPQTALLIDGGDATTDPREGTNTNIVFMHLNHIKSQGSYGVIAYPHGKQTNILFSDGHVSSQGRPPKGKPLDVAYLDRTGEWDYYKLYR